MSMTLDNSLSRSPLEQLNEDESVSVLTELSKLKLTAFSKWDMAWSVFFVWANITDPSWRWVLASSRGGGLKVKILCKQWIHSLMLGGFDVRKCSAKPRRDAYQDSDCDCWPDAILLSSRWSEATPQQLYLLFTSAYLQKSTTLCKIFEYTAWLLAGNYSIMCYVCQIYGKYDCILPETKINKHISFSIVTVILNTETNTETPRKDHLNSEKVPKFTRLTLSGNWQ